MHTLHIVLVQAKNLGADITQVLVQDLFFPVVRKS